MTYLYLLILGFVLLIGPAGCERSSETGETSTGSTSEVTSSDVKQDVNKAIDTTMDYAGKKKKEYEDKMAAELNRLGDRIHELQTQAGEAGEDAQARLEATVEKLRKKQEQVEEKLDELRDKAPDAWKDFRSGVDAAMDDLNKAYDDAKKEFTSD